MSLKNWDNKTWLSSTSYIKSFNKFLIKETKLNKNSEILDIGCGRGKILGNLTSKLRLIKKPIGIDIERHKDRDKRIIFNKTDAISYLKKNRKKFDLVLGMYHDQVLAPIKTLFEYDAINITIGLPFIRVSPDHGPNETMLGKNKSNYLSLLKSIKFLDF